MTLKALDKERLEQTTATIISKDELLSLKDIYEQEIAEAQARLAEINSRLELLDKAEIG